MCVCVPVDTAVRESHKEEKEISGSHIAEFSDLKKKEKDRSNEHSNTEYKGEEKQQPGTVCLYVSTQQEEKNKPTHIHTRARSLGGDAQPLLLCRRQVPRHHLRCQAVQLADDPAKHTLQGLQ